MTNIVVVFPKPEISKNIKNILVRNGFTVTAACTTGAQVLEVVEEYNGGIVISGYRLMDMMYSELAAYLPEEIDMLLLASPQYLETADRKIIGLAMPLKVHELISTVGMMVENAERKKRKRRALPRARDGEEKLVIRDAKLLLMERNHMTEEEAHRYLQKNSMDSGTNMVETAKMVLAAMKY